jgi:hypothetical protein
MAQGQGDLLVRAVRGAITVVYYVAVSYYITESLSMSGNVNVHIEDS